MGRGKRSKEEMSFNLYERINKPYSMGNYLQGLDDIVGLDDLIEQLRSFIVSAKTPERLTCVGAKPYRKLLIEGASGSGKSLLAIALANECGEGIPVLYLSLLKATEKSDDDLCQQIRALIEQVNRYFPCIVYLDDMDTLSSNTRSELDEEGISEATKLIMELIRNTDAEYGGGFLIATATDLNRIPYSIIKACAFDLVKNISFPDYEDRLEIIKIHARGKTLATDVILEDISARTPGLTGKSIAWLFDEAARATALKGSLEIDKDTIYETLTLLRIKNVELGINSDVLSAGVDKWNQWRLQNPKALPSFECCDLSEADLQGINLSGMNLRKARMSRANLNGADLSDSDLYEADFQCAKLRDANLTRSQALNTNFYSAELTGACIQDWNINSSTNLHSVECDFIFLQNHQKERRPYSRNFSEDEFTRLFEKVIETIDLVFINGIDWQAFAFSYKQLQVRYGEKELSVQAIEQKADGTFVIRLSISPDFNKAEIEEYALLIYENAVKEIESRYSAQMSARNDQIAILKEHNDTLEKIMLALAGKSTYNVVEVTAQSESKSMSDSSKTKYDLSNSNVGGIIDTAQSGSNPVIHQSILQSNESKSLAEAAAEIQKLLVQLDRLNPSATIDEKIAYLSNETSFGFKSRVVRSIQAGGEAAIEEFLDNPYINIAKATIKAWMSA